MASSSSSSCNREAEPSSEIPSNMIEQQHQLNFPQRKKKHLHANQRAQIIYQTIVAKRKAEEEKRKLEKEKRQKSLEEYTSVKRKMNKALSRKNRKGQPNLNAQIEVLLEKIEKRMEKSE